LLAVGRLLEARDLGGKKKKRIPTCLPKLRGRASGDFPEGSATAQEQAPGGAGDRGSRTAAGRRGGKGGRRLYTPHRAASPRLRQGSSREKKKGGGGGVSWGGGGGGGGALRGITTGSRVQIHSFPLRKRRRKKGGESVMIQDFPKKLSETGKFYPKDILQNRGWSKGVETREGKKKEENNPRNSNRGSEEKFGVEFCHFQTFFEKVLNQGKEGKKRKGGEKRDGATLPRRPRRPGEKEGGGNGSVTIPCRRRGEPRRFASPRERKKGGEKPACRLFSANLYRPLPEPEKEKKEREEKETEPVHASFGVGGRFTAIF